MKIRTDFVTNSSSSSFCVSIQIEDIHNKHYAVYLDADADGDGKPDLYCTAEDILKANDMDELAALLSASAQDESKRYNGKYKKQIVGFTDKLKRAIPDLRKIRTITMVRSWNAWGEAASGLVWNDEELQSLAAKVNRSSGDEKEESLKALEQYVKEASITAESEYGDEWPTGFLGGGWSGHFVWEGSMEELAECLCENGMSGNDDAKETTVIDMQEKAVTHSAEYRLEMSGEYRLLQRKKQKAAAMAAGHSSGLNMNNDEFEILNGYLEKYKGKGGNVAIPAGVTSIGDYAFNFCDSLTSVTIPEGVTSIGDSAFYNCDSLTSVTIPDSVTSIGDSAFSYCKNLTSVTIPDSVTSIGDSAFSGCDSLTSVTIPAGVTSIGDYAFSFCDSLTSVTIPEGVTSIGNSAFHYCKNLTSVTIPDSVTSIGDAAFEECRSLTSVTIPKSVTGIGATAFSSCEKLMNITVSEENAHYKSVDGVLFNKNRSVLLCCPGGRSGEYSIPAGVTSIGDSAFSGCNSLTDVTIPEGVTSIGKRAFYSCSLTSVTIPDSVTSIGDEAFEFGSLTSVTIPGSITEISPRAFSWSIRVRVRREPIEIDTLTHIFEVFHGRLYTYNGKGGDIAIPKGVTEIGCGAFYECRSLQSVVIPEGVTHILGDAFSGCTGLQSVVIPKSVTYIGESAFSDCSDLDITIGEGVKEINWQVYNGDKVFKNCRNVRLQLPHSMLTNTKTLPAELAELLVGADALDVAYVLLYQKAKAWQTWAQKYTEVEPAAVLKELVGILQKKNLAKPATAKQVNAYLHFHSDRLPVDETKWILQYFSAFIPGSDWPEYRAQLTNGAAGRASARCQGLTFVITGNVFRFQNRDAFTKYVLSQGGKVSGTVSAKTSYLVNNDVSSTSTKNRTAKAMGVPIISEEEFIRKFGIDE